MKKINTTYLIALSALVFASCSESDGLSSGIPLSKEKIAFAATLQDGWNGGTSAEAGNNSRAGKPTFSGLAMEQKVLTANEGLAKPLYLHPLETENTSVMNAMPQTRGAMNESVGSFGVSAVYSKDGANYSPLFQNEEATQNGSYWFTSSNATWPLDGSVSFYAYAPYNDASLSLQGSDAVVKNKTIRYTANTDFSKQPDLIVAKSENNAFTSSTANKAVGLSFSHALTAITFSISADMIPGKVKSITVSGVYGQGDYDFSNAPWPPTSLANPSTYVITPKDPSVKAGESKALTDKNSALMMIPQDLDANANAKVSMVFNDGSEKDKTVSFSLNGTWDAGKHITYVLSSSKITTLNMGSLTYPTGWNSVNTDAKNQIRKAYAPNTSAGLFVVNEKNKVIEANVQLTYDGTSWSLSAGSKLKFSPQYNYFVYYPYQKGGLPGAPAKDASNIDVTSAEKFFANAIATWKEHNIAADQSTLEKMNDCDLQIGKASLDEDGCRVSFKMEHAMGLAEITLGATTFDNNYYLSNYPSYTWKNGTTTFHAYAGISGYSLYKVADYRYVALVNPDITTDFSCSSSTDPDSWTGMVSVKPATNGIDRVIATSKRTSWPDISYNTMAVGDIYYSDGAITKPEDISAARANGKTPIGVIGYLGNNKWTESGTGSGYGGHALVMCLKNIDSNGTTDMGQGYRWYSKDTDCGGFKVDTGDKIRGSFDKDYGSGYKETVAKGSAFEAANAAKIYNTLPAPTNKCTGWFLPSAGQYYAVMSQLGGGIYPDDWKINEFFGNMTTVSGKINAALSKVGPNQYTEFFQGIDTGVWTSSEFSATHAVYVDSGVYDRRGPGSFRFYADSYGYKTDWLPVRPFLAF